MNCNDELNACGREPERLLREPYRATRIWRSILPDPLPSIPYPGPRWPGRKRGTAVVSNMVPRGLSVRYENCQNCGGASSPGDAVSRLDAHFPAVLEQRLGPTEGFSSAVTGLNVTAMASASRIRRGNASRSIAVVQKTFQTHARLRGACPRSDCDHLVAANRPTRYTVRKLGPVNATDANQEEGGAPRYALPNCITIRRRMIFEMNRIPLFFVFALAACASTGSEDPRQVAQAMEPLGCVDRAQCDIYWQRAKVWISSNSYYRVQLSSDSVIETYGPYAGRMELAYRVLKIPDGAGGARISVTAECGNVFRCSPTVTDAIAAFKRFASSGG